MLFHFALFCFAPAFYNSIYNKRCSFIHSVIFIIVNIALSLWTRRSFVAPPPPPCFCHLVPTPLTVPSTTVSGNSASHRQTDRHTGSEPSLIQLHFPQNLRNIAEMVHVGWWVSFSSIRIGQQTKHPHLWIPSPSRTSSPITLSDSLVLFYHMFLKIGDPTCKNVMKNCIIRIIVFKKWKSDR